MNVPQHIANHLEDFADQLMTEEGRSEVEAWTRESDDNARQFTDWFVWQAMLRDVETLEEVQQALYAADLRRPAFLEITSVASQVNSSPRTHPMSIESAGMTSRPPSALRTIQEGRQRALWRQVALAASIALVASGAAFLWWMDMENGSDGSYAVASVPERPALSLPVTPLSAAYLGRTSGCQWVGDSVDEGAQFAAGDVLEISMGQMDLIFESGASVTTVAPCRLEINGPADFSLHRGDVSVEASFGFKVSTPSGVVIDLGTAFGVSVDEDGGSEVHVFEGEVVFQAVNVVGDASLKSIVLRKDDALRYSVAGVSLEEFRANEEKFAWRDREQVPKDSVPKLPVCDDLELWLAADRCVEVDAENRVQSWRDLLVATNTSAEDALQPASEYRPTVTPDGLNGRPSILFDGKGSFLLTPPLYTADEQTAFVVCSLDALQPRTQFLLNYNGPPQRKVGAYGGRISPGVFQIILRDGNADGRFAVVGHLFSGYKAGRRGAITNEVEDSDRMTVGEPLVICFRHSLREQRMTLFINGELVETKPSSAHVAIVSRKIIGRHPILDDRDEGFAGHIGEVLIYNRALPIDQVRAVSMYLEERFGLGASS